MKSKNGGKQMKKENNDRLEKAIKRSYLVVKDNTLIQKSRFELSLTEQKTIAFICSMIKPTDSNRVGFQLEYDFNIQDYCKVCGIDYKSGKNYADIKGVLQALRDRSMWIEMDDGSESLCGWLSKARTNKKSGVAHITLDEDLVPYLFNLGQSFTKYQLSNVLAMKSAFSVRIYELMKSYEFRKVIKFDIDELKRLLMCENTKSYERYPDFRRKVLDMAMSEINALTDLNVSYEPIKLGRKYVAIEFHIALKNLVNQAIAENATYQQLDGQMDITDYPEYLPD